MARKMMAAMPSILQPLLLSLTTYTQGKELQNPISDFLPCLEADLPSQGGLKGRTELGSVVPCVNTGIRYVLGPISNGTLAGYNSLGVHSKHCEHGKSAVLNFLEL